MLTCEGSVAAKLYTGIEFFSSFHVMFYCLLKICIIMQIMHSVISRDFIYPIILKSNINKNFMVFIKIYGFTRFLCNVFAWQVL